MKILTLGDSWTYGSESTDPMTKSWPAQMSKLYDVDVTNLARPGSSNQRAARIGIEELASNSDYDWIIWPLGPASRTEILKVGKWYQIWPRLGHDVLDKIYTELWHPWNDVQSTLLLVLQFIAVANLFGVKIFITGLSLKPNQYKDQISWIKNYKDDNDFRSLGMPLDEFNIGIGDLNRKLIKLRAIFESILLHQPEFFFDVVDEHLTPEYQGVNIWAPQGHPNDIGYEILAHYFANKIGIS